MRGLKFSEALKSGQRLYGTLIVSPSPFWPTLVSTLGLDYVFIDTEHIAIDRTELSWMCRTYQAMNIVPVVRILSKDPSLASAVLDGGACGVMVPYVETVEEVEKLVGAVKLRPVKGDKLNQILAGHVKPEPVLDKYLSHHNADNALIINIESTPGLERLDDILGVSGVDAVLIGPHDLSCSLGVPEQYTNPVFVEAVEEIIRRTREHNVGVGIHMSFPGEDGALEQEIRWIRAGANMILHSADAIAFRDTMRRELDHIKQALNETTIKEVPSTRTKRRVTI